MHTIMLSLAGSPNGLQWMLDRLYNAIIHHFVNESNRQSLGARKKREGALKATEWGVVHFLNITRHTHEMGSCVHLIKITCIFLIIIKHKSNNANDDDDDDNSDVLNLIYDTLEAEEEGLHKSILWRRCCIAILQTFSRYQRKGKSERGNPSSDPGWQEATSGENIKGAGQCYIPGSCHLRASFVLYFGEMRQTSNPAIFFNEIVALTTILSH